MLNREAAIGDATAFCLAWQQRFGKWPGEHCYTLGLTVPWHETNDGRAWTKRWSDPPRPSNNCGAATLRGINAAECAAVVTAGRALLVHSGLADRTDLAWAPEGWKVSLDGAERAALAPLTPNVGHDHAARSEAIQAAIRDAGLPLPEADVHCDSRTITRDGRTIQVPYAVWFYTPATLAEGMAYLQRILVGARGQFPARGILDDPDGTPEELAAAMYRRGYFWGFHSHATPEGNAQNVRDYAHALDVLWPTWRHLLAGWSPTHLEPLPPPPPRLPLSEGMRGEDVRSRQLIFGASPDGDWGVKTTAACDAWRRAHGLPVPPEEWDQACEDVVAGRDPHVVPADEPPAPRLNLVQLDPGWAAMNAERDAQLEGGI